MVESRKYHSYRTAEVRVMEESKYDVNYNINVDIYSKSYTLKLFNALKIKDRALSSSIPQNGEEVANLQEAFTCLIKI